MVAKAEEEEGLDHFNGSEPSAPPPEALDL